MLAYTEDPKDNIPSSGYGPKDWSLAAYKVWVLEQRDKLAPAQPEDQWTREEWIESWRAYWKNPTAK